MDKNYNGFHGVNLSNCTKQKKLRFRGAFSFILILFSFSPLEAALTFLEYVGSKFLLLR